MPHKNQKEYMRKNTSSLLLFIFFSFINLNILGTINFSTKQLSKNTHEITLDIAVSSPDFFYKDYIDFSVDHPAIALSNWQTSIKPIAQYDPSFKETKQIYNKNFSIKLTATTSQTNITDANLYFTYYQQSKKKIKQKLFTLDFITKKPSQEQADATTQSTGSLPAIPHNNTTSKNHSSWSDYIGSLVSNTNSLLLKIFLVLLLGILMSLTPCIYPMIPITVGILQSQSGNSIIRNFFLAFAYTTGIATTFSLFGLLAVFTGQLFGSFLTHPLVIMPVVGLLGYLGFSMLGFYEMYTPSFLQKSNQNKKNGSLLSAFLFGAASGTVASPCLSPGLILLLSIVTTLGDKFLGFILLFAFGIGLSIPLLLIGTFSSSLSLLPRAGSWMIEIKKLFGFMLLGMCFYLLKNILSWPLLMWSISLFTIATALFYLYQAHNMQLSTQRMINNTLGTLLLTGSVLLCFKSYQASNPIPNIIEAPLWLTDYSYAQAQAQQDQKKILLDISAPFCTICKAIDNKLFADEQVCHALNTIVPVKIDCSDTNNQHYAALQKKYTIVGAPTFILIDPTTEKEIKRWGSELYDISPQDFIAELNQYK